MNICRITQQAENKKPRARWVQEILPWYWTDRQPETSVGGSTEQFADDLAETIDSELGKDLEAEPEARVDESVLTLFCEMSYIELKAMVEAAWD